MSSLKNVKRFEDLRIGQWFALGTKVGGIECVLEILRDEKILILQDRPESFFNDQGRVIPLLDLKNQVVKPSREYSLVQPELKESAFYAGALERFNRYFCNFSMGDCEFLFFVSKAKDLITQIRNTKSLRNLLRGVHLPICLPGFDKEGFDYGSKMEEFISIFEKSWKDRFKENEIRRWSGLKLGKKIKIVDISRHDQLILKMMIAGLKKEPVVAIYFPNSFQGFSFQASRKQMRVLPKGLLLSGAFDTIAAMIMHPDVLLCGVYTPGLYLAALKQEDEPDDCLWFNLGYGDREVLFNRNGSFEEKDNKISAPNFSSGLLYIGTE